MYSREQQSSQQPITSYIADYGETSSPDDSETSTKIAGSRKRKLSMPVRRHKLLEYVVCGPPNSGKTKLINEYLCKTKGKNDHVFWLKAENKSRLKVNFSVFHETHQLGDYVGKNLYDTDDFSVIVADVYRCLLSTGGRLVVVFENVDSFENIKEFLVPKEFYNHEVRYVVSTSSETVFGVKRDFTTEFLTNEGIVGILNKVGMQKMGQALNLHLQTSSVMSLNINHASMEIFLTLMKLTFTVPREVQILKTLKDCSNPDVALNRVVHQLEVRNLDAVRVLQFIVLCGSFMVPEILLKTVFRFTEVRMYLAFLQHHCKLVVESPSANFCTSQLVYDVILKKLISEKQKPLYHEYIKILATDLDMKRDEIGYLPLNYFTSVMHFVKAVRMKKPKSDPLLDKTICQLLLHVIRGVRKCKNTTLALEYIEYTRKTCPSILKYECLCTLKIEEFKISAQRREDDDYNSKFQEIREMILKDYPSESIRNALMYRLYKTLFKFSLRMKTYPTKHVIETLRALKPTGPEGNKLATWDVFIFLQNNAMNSLVWNQAVLLPYMRSTSQICQEVELAICSYTNNPRGLINQFLQCCRQLGVRHWKSVNCLLQMVRYTCRKTPHTGTNDPYTHEQYSKFNNYNFITNMGVMEMLKDEISVCYAQNDFRKLNILKSCVPPMHCNQHSVLKTILTEPVLDETVRNFDGLNVTDDLILRCFICLLTYEQKFETAMTIASRCVRKLEINMAAQQQKQQQKQSHQELHLKNLQLQQSQSQQQQSQQQQTQQAQQQQSLSNNKIDLLHSYTTNRQKWLCIHKSIAMLEVLIANMI